MKPAPPVTSIFTRGLSLDQVPDVRADEVPGQPALVALGGSRLKLHVDEVDDAAARGANVLDAVGHAGGDADQTRGPVAHGETAEDLLRGGASQAVDQDEQHHVAWWATRSIGMA